MVRFLLSLVYRVFDIEFTEGVEAIFRFALALLKKSEDSLVRQQLGALQRVHGVSWEENH